MVANNCQYLTGEEIKKVQAQLSIIPAAYSLEPIIVAPEIFTSSYAASSIQNFFPPKVVEEIIINSNHDYLASLPPLQPNNIEITKVKINEADEGELCSLDIEYPQVSGLVDLSIEEQINQYLEDIFLSPAVHEEYDIVRPFNIDACAEKLKQFQVNCLTESENPKSCVQNTYSAGGSYIVSLNVGNLLSIRDDGYLSYTHPSAHPTKHRIWTNINLQTGEIYECKDFFKLDSESKVKLAELYRLSPYYPCTTTTITETGFLVAPYSSHAGFWATYEIPYVFLKDLIKPDGPLQMFLPPAQRSTAARLIVPQREALSISLTDTVGSVALSPDGQLIVSSSGNTVQLWDLQGNPIGEPFQAHNRRVYSVAFSPDGQLIVTSGGALSNGADTVRLWDLQGNPIGDILQADHFLFGSVAFSPDGKHILGISFGELKLWDLQGNLIGEPFEGHEGRVNSVAFSPDGKTIVSGSQDKTLRLWDLDGNPIGEAFEGHDSFVRSVAFSPDGQRIASSSWDNTVRLWDLHGNPIGEPFQGHAFPVSSVAFSPDGQHLISGGMDETVRLWDLQGNQIGESFQGHTGPIHFVTFSPDGQYIISSSYDGTVRLWKVQTNFAEESF